MTSGHCACPFIHFSFLKSSIFKLSLSEYVVPKIGLRLNASKAAYQSLSRPPDDAAAWTLLLAILDISKLYNQYALVCVVKVDNYPIK